MEEDLRKIFIYLMGEEEEEREEFMTLLMIFGKYYYCSTSQLMPFDLFLCVTHTPWRH